jgi:hypothetical protein
MAGLRATGAPDPSNSRMTKVFMRRF